MSSKIAHSKSISLRGSFDAEVFDESHATDVLNSLYRNKKHCDVTIETSDGAKFPVHRCVLSSCSEFFDQQFAEQSTDASHNVLKLKAVTSSIMEIVIKYVYTSALTITDENVYDLYAAAVHTKMKPIKRHCSKYLLSGLKPDGYLAVYESALERDLDDVRDKLQALVAENLQSNKEQFAALAPAKFCRVVEIRNKTLICEEETYVAIVDWVKGDYNNRSKYFKGLFQSLKISLFPRHFLKNVVRNEELVRTCNACLSAVVDELAKDVLTHHRRHRKQTKEVDSSFLVFTKESSIHKFDILERCWHDVYEKSIDRKETTVVFIDNCFYLLGGSDSEGTPTNAVAKLSLSAVAKGWVKLRPMRVARRHCGAACHNGLIYVVGGTGEDGETLSSVEVYDPKSDNWATIPSMKHERSHPSLVSSNGCLFVLAGNRNEEKLQSVERYDPSAKLWKTMSPIPLSKLYGPSAVAMNGVIYLIATIGLHASLEALQYNPVNDSWTQLTSYNLPYLYTSACAVDGLIYLIDKWRKGDEIAIFDPQADDWTTIIPAKKLGFRVRVSVASAGNV